jgi:hypothetical protein
MAIRGTLGASRGRLVQQLVVEALFLAVAGAVLAGVALLASAGLAGGTGAAQRGASGVTVAMSV